MSDYKSVETLTKEEIQDACKKSRSVRQVSTLLHIHLSDIKTLLDRIVGENVDISHFNKGDIKCPGCGENYEVMTVLDFDDVGRKLGRCKKCKKTEWVEDGGDIIDAYHYFTEGYKTHEMIKIGHTNI